MIKKQLTTMEKLSFGGGDVANCVTFGVTSAYLSYYYTDTVGISVAAVGRSLQKRCQPSGEMFSGSLCSFPHWGFWQPCFLTWIKGIKL